VKTRLSICIFIIPILTKYFLKYKQNPSYFTLTGEEPLMKKRICSLPSLTDVSGYVSSPRAHILCCWR